MFAFVVGTEDQIHDLMLTRQATELKNLVNNREFLSYGSGVLGPQLVHRPTVRASVGLSLLRALENSYPCLAVAARVPWLKALSSIFRSSSTAGPGWGTPDISLLLKAEAERLQSLSSARQLKSLCKILSQKFEGGGAGV